MCCSTLTQLHNLLQQHLESIPLHAATGMSNNHLLHGTICDLKNIATTLGEQICIAADAHQQLRYTLHERLKSEASNSKQMDTTKSKK